MPCFTSRFLHRGLRLHGAGRYNNAGMTQTVSTQSYTLDLDGKVRKVRGQRTRRAHHHSYPSPPRPLPPPPSEPQVNAAKRPFSSSSSSVSVSPSVRRLHRREFHAEKPFCISAQSRQAPKQLRLIAAQLAWTLFIRRSVGIHQAELAQIRRRAFFFPSFFPFSCAMQLWSSTQASLKMPRRRLDAHFN